MFLFGNSVKEVCRLMKFGSTIISSYSTLDCWVSARVETLGGVDAEYRRHGYGFTFGLLSGIETDNV